MGRGRPLKPLDVSSETREELESLANSRTLAAGLVRRAKIVLMCADGLPNDVVAQRVSLSRASVGKWRERFRLQGLMGLYDERRPGRPRTLKDEKISGLITKTLETKPEDGSTQWSCRSAAAETDLSKSTVQRIWSTLGINPPDHAMVLCVDEKSQIQALERSQPLLPLGLGYVEGVTHDYIRHGTTTLFAALDVASGKVINQCKPRHRHQEFLQFLKHIDENVPTDLDIHLVVDNYCTHKHAKVKRWIGARPRYQIHYTPTYSSWLNQVEIWFNIITQKAIRRGSCKAVKELVEKIRTFTDNYNAKVKPFKWTATPEAILRKIERLCEAISGTRH